MSKDNKLGDEYDLIAETSDGTQLGHAPDMEPKDHLAQVSSFILEHNAKYVITYLWRDENDKIQGSTEGNVPPKHQITMMQEGIGYLKSVES